MTTFFELLGLLGSVIMNPKGHQCPTCGDLALGGMCENHDCDSHQT